MRKKEPLRYVSQRSNTRGKDGTLYEMATTRTFAAQAVFPLRVCVREPVARARMPPIGDEKEIHTSNRTTTCS